MPKIPKHNGFGPNMPRHFPPATLQLLTQMKCVECSAIGNMSYAAEIIEWAAASCCAEGICVAKARDAIGWACERFAV